MPRAPQKFKQTDVTRVYKGIAAAGIAPEQIEVEITETGSIFVRPFVRSADPAGGQENPWDEVLK